MSIAPYGKRCGEEANSLDLGEQYFGDRFVPAARKERRSEVASAEMKTAHHVRGNI